MDPASLTMMALTAGAGAAGASMLNKPALPDIPSPIPPPEAAKPKPKRKASMQDSFMTGVAGAGVAPTPRGKTLLGE